MKKIFCFFLLQSLTGIILLLSQPKFGVCVPSGCSADDVRLNYAALYSSVGAEGDVLTCETVETQDEMTEWDDASYLAV